MSLKKYLFRTSKTILYLFSLAYDIKIWIDIILRTLFCNMIFVTCIIKGLSVSWIDFQIIA